MYLYTVLDFSGFPHSKYSPVVNGNDESNIVVKQSTKGTSRIALLYKEGFLFTTFPISNPPAEPPDIDNPSAET